VVVVLLPQALLLSARVTALLADLALGMERSPLAVAVDDRGAPVELSIGTDEVVLAGRRAPRVLAAVERLPADVKLRVRPLELAGGVGALPAARARLVVARPHALLPPRHATALLPRHVVHVPLSAALLAGHGLGGGAFALLHVERPPFVAVGEPLGERALRAVGDEWTLDLLVALLGVVVRPRALAQVVRV